MHYDWNFGFLLQYSRIIGVGAAYTIGFTILTAGPDLLSDAWWRSRAYLT